MISTKGCWFIYSFYVIFPHGTSNIIIVIQDRSGTRTRWRKYSRSSKTNKHYHAGAWRRCVLKKNLSLIIPIRWIHIYTCSCRERKKVMSKLHYIDDKYLVWYSIVIIKQHIEKKKKRVLPCVISATSRVAPTRKENVQYLWNETCHWLVDRSLYIISHLLS